MHIKTAKGIELCRVCALMIALALVFVSLYVSVPAARAETDGMVRVKLTRLGAPSEIVLKADCDYYLASDSSVRLKAGSQLSLKADGEKLVLTSGGKSLTLGGTAKLMRAESGRKGVRFLKPELSNRFCGDLGFTASGGVINTLLNIYIEDYLCGVVGYEMSPSSAIEALKAQAVASRTYALRRRAERGAAAYDLTDTATDQVFKGLSGSSEYDNVMKAVEATRGGVLYYGNSLAQCWFGASNGGQMESSRNAWGISVPYSTVQDDPYDLESGATVKTASINKDATGMHPLLKSALIEGMREQLSANNLSTAAADIRINGVESVSACDSRYPAPSRVYKSLTFKLNVTGVTAGGESRTGTVTVSIPTFGGFENWYDLSLNADDNETVWVTETDRTFEIAFRRYGHGVGLSQRGAQCMAANYGRSMAQILTYYYPGTEGRVLTLTDTTRDEPTSEATAQRAVIATARLSDRTDLLDAPSSDASSTASVAAGAVVDVYAVQGDWAAVGSSGRYGFVPVDSLSSFAMTGASVVRPEGTAYALGTRNTSVLKLPVEQASAVSSLIAGARVRVYAWTDAWAMIQSTDGRTGFVPLDALHMEDQQETTDDADKGEDEIITPDALYAQLKRDAALLDENGEVSDMGTLYQGSVVRIVAYNSQWAKVRTQDDVEGFLPLDSLSALDAAAVNRDGSNDGEEIEGGPITRVSGEKYLYVKADSINVYESWSTDSGVVAALRAGDKVRVGAYNDVWACVRTSDGKQGFVQRAQMTENAPQKAADGVVYQDCDAVTQRALTVYASVKAKAAKVGQVPQGAQVRVRAWNDAMAYVEFGDIAGFVALDGLKKLN